MSNKIVPQTYRTVIDDVINNIRSEFDAYGVSEDVLSDLQARWEAKIIASRVAEFEPATRNAETSSGVIPPPPPPPPPQYQHPYPPPHPPPSAAHYHQYQNSGPLPPISVKTEPGLEPRPLTVGQAMHMQQTFVLPQAPRPVQPGQPGGNESVLQFSQQQQQQRRAGGGGGGAPPWSGPSTGKGRSREGSIPRIIPQLDGPSSSASSDSSSTPPPGAGLQSGLPPRPTSSQGAVRNDSSTGNNEEINSELDDSDSDGEGAEETETGGTEQDIVFCTYDKVARVKNKWKCVLKDGMVHVNGKDYLFAKCTGEFEW